jgi:hypothetical protein
MTLLVHVRAGGKPFADGRLSRRCPGEPASLRDPRRGGAAPVHRRLRSGRRGGPPNRRHASLYGAGTARGRHADACGRLVCVWSDAASGDHGRAAAIPYAARPGHRRPASPGLCRARGARCAWGRRSSNRSRSRPHAASAAPANACSASVPVASASEHRHAAARSAPARSEAPSAHGRHAVMRGSSLPTLTAATHCRSVVHRFRSKPARQVQTRARVSSMECPISPNRQSARPMAEAE